ncbi:major capsid protein [Blastococcus goldschmidtiae]|uniref:Major capsid protein n=1 Tax=Blastococcus goldschmidtiae TaxID=3075546 RepID=A0ABU2K948_9ACTN|nr:major capsid protein [Blastococcus sp. DSM 46792]MDT0276711.1 major capsid protein [Blastococcus sp. DSM 46792]
MDRIKDLLGRITELADDELEELRGLILDAADTFNVDPTRVHGVESTEKLESLAAAATTVKQEVRRRESNVKAAHEATRVLASFRTEPLRTAARVPDDRLPIPRRSTGGAATRALTASGTELGGTHDFSDEFLTQLRTYQGTRGTHGDKVLVATVKVDRPSSRVLRTTDSAEVVTAAFAAAADEHAVSQVALTAAGGRGPFTDTDYTLIGFESAVRPVKTSLPTFTVQRGGVRFVRPPRLGDLTGSVGIWTMQNDIDALTDPAVRKPMLRVQPGGETLVDLQAITSILVFGNLMQRAYPEFVQRVMDLATAFHAKIAEQQLLTQIGSLSTAVTGPASDLGATRVLLPLLDRTATAMRNRLRMPANAVLQLILPDWSRGILRSDLALQEPGDATLGVTDAELMTYFATRNLSVTWAMDGEAGQHFDPQAPGAVNDWPGEIVSYMFPAGAFQFLDGGTLDLGLVRDSQLNAANDFSTFMETFEAVAFRGGEAFRISQAVTPSGVARAAA